MMSSLKIPQTLNVKRTPDQTVIPEESSTVYQNTTYNDSPIKVKYQMLQSVINQALPRTIKTGAKDPYKLDHLIPCSPQIRPAPGQSHSSLASPRSIQAFSLSKRVKKSGKTKVTSPQPKEQKPLTMGGRGGVKYEPPPLTSSKQP